MNRIFCCDLLAQIKAMIAVCVCERINSCRWYIIQLLWNKFSTVTVAVGLL